MNHRHGAGISARNNPPHPARKAIATHRAWFASFVKDLLGELGIHDRDGVADQLIMLRDGGMVTGYLGPDPAALADTLLQATRAVLNDAT